MRKHILFAGMLLVTALILAVPSKADSVNYLLTGPGVTATFSLPGTFTPPASGPIVFNNIVGTLIGGGNNGPQTFGTIQISTSAFMGVTDFWTIGSGNPNPNLGIFATGLFTMNPDGSITLNGGTFHLGDYHLFFPFNQTDRPFTLTATVIPGPVGTPEPATLALLGAGGLALAALRRRKSA
jgi:hypothetical protein